MKGLRCIFRFGRIFLGIFEYTDTPISFLIILIWTMIPATLLKNSKFPLSLCLTLSLNPNMWIIHNFVLIYFFINGHRWCPHRPIIFINLIKVTVSNYYSLLISIKSNHRSILGLNLLIGHICQFGIMINSHFISILY